MGSSMNLSRILIGIVVGAAFSGIVFGIASYFYTVNNHSSTTFGPASDWWAFAVIIGIVFGVMVGGLFGAFVTGLKMRFLTASILGGLINLFIVVIFLAARSEVKNVAMKYSLYSLIPLGVINGVVVSYFSSSSQHLE